MMSIKSISNERITHYVLTDGRIWSIDDARFVSSVPNDAITGPCTDEQGDSTLEGLIGCLEFYGYPKGELATPKDKAKEEIPVIEKWLSDHDYIGIKIATGRATKEEYASQIEEMNEKAARLEELKRILNN